MHNPSFLALRKAQLLLAGAALLWALSWILVDSAWRVMWIEPPRWMGVAQAFEFTAPHEQILQAILDGWHSIVSAFASAGWVSSESAARIINEGYSLSGFLRFLAVVCMALVFWVVSRALVAQTEGNTQASDLIVESGDSQKAEPFFEEVSAADEAQSPLPQELTLEDLAQSLSQAKLVVTNLQLDPQAQGFSDELSQASRHLLKASMEVHKLRDAPQFKPKGS